VRALYVEHEANLRLRIDGAAEHDRDLIELPLLPRIGDNCLAGDEMRLAFHDGVDDLEMISAERAARLGDFNDGVGQHGRLYFRRAPAELDLDIDSLRSKIALRYFHQFGGDDFALEVFGLLKSARFGHCQDPAHLASALLGIGESGYAWHFEAAFDHPVDAGEARIQHAVVNIARHLLCADQHALNLAVVDGREIRTAVGIDIPTRALEESNSGVLQTALRNAETKFFSHGSPPALLWNA